MAKEKKKRADKYEKKLSIKGSFDDVIKLSVTPASASNKQEEKPEEEKKKSKPTKK